MAHMDSALFGLSVLPSWLVVISGLFFWLPGELFLGLLGARLLQGSAAYLLLGQLPFIVALLAVAQLVVGHINVFLTLFLLAAFSSLSLVFRSKLFSRLGLFADSVRQDSVSLGDCLINSSFVVSIYVAFLYVIWWLPAGIRGVWVWPLQFEPDIYSVAPWSIASLLAFLVIFSRWKIKGHRFGLGLMALPVVSLSMQSAAWLSQSVDLIQVYTLDKITGYYSASLVFKSIPDLFARFNDLLPGLPYHVVSHPVGKVLVFKLASQVFESPADLFAVRLVVAVVSSCSTLLVWQLVWRLWGSERSALLAGVLCALLPSVAFFSPLFDSFNVFLSVLLMLCWVCSLQAQSVKRCLALSCLLGCVGYLSIFFAFNLLIVGVFLLGALPALALQSVDRDCFWKRVGSVVLFSSAILCLSGVAVHVATGYDLLEGLRASLEMDELVRPSQYRSFVSRLFNVQELIWGIGGLNFFLLCSVSTFLLFPRFRRQLSNGSTSSRRWMGLDSPQLFFSAQVVSVALINFIGVLSGETSRLYAVFMPFLLAGLVGVLNSLSLRSALIAALGSALWIAVGVWRYQFIW